MKTALGLAAALSFAALGALATPAMAQQGGSAMETGSNATDTKGAGMSKSDKMSGGKMQGKKMKKKKM